MIEAGGTPDKLGTPIAFIEAAWRRYTKHSKNKVQEIQGALLPIVELHKLSAPFYGAVLAGDFSKPSLDQLRNNNFSVLYIPYKDVVDAFMAVKFDIAFDEETPDKKFANASAKLAALSAPDLDKIRNALIAASKTEIEKFMSSLKKTLERIVSQVILIPMFGTEVVSTTVSDALTNLAKIDLTRTTGRLQKIEVVVDYSNGDVIRASFGTVENATDFLTGLQR